LKSNSFFLFGARGTGKSTFLSYFFSADEAQYIDLLDPVLFARLQSNPSELNEILATSDSPWCLIDEVQKIPPLLDIVHSQIERSGRKFALTGSSARNLKRNSANMLGGRAFLYKMFPLTHQELGDNFNLEGALNFGTLAKCTTLSTEREKVLFLRSYVETYLKEEILIEQLIRNLPPFRRFLELSAATDTEVVSYTNIAKDVQSDPRIIQNYYSILEDTLLGFFLEPFHLSLRKRQKKAPKFYWFDTGVRRALSGTIDIPVTPKSFEYGSLFESFLVNEIHRLLTYSERSFRLSFIRIDDNLEIDLVIERAGLPTYLIEIKSTTHVTDAHTRTLERYSKEISGCVSLVLSQDKIAKKIGSVTCLHWLEGIEELGITLP